MRRKGQDSRRHNVCGDDVVFAAGFVRKIAHQHGKVLGHAVSLGILAGGAHAHGVNIHALGFGSAQLQRSNGQNAGAGADIQHTFAAFYHAVQRFQAQAGGFVGAGAKGHAGVHRDHNSVSIIGFPAGYNG